MIKVKPHIVVADYGVGNIFSICRACEISGLRVSVSAERTDLEAADAILLPGVGAFADAMIELKQRDLIGPIQDLVRNGKPILGVCLGFQLLFAESHEFGKHRGLGLIDGTVERLPNLAVHESPRLKVPQVGWNRIHQTMPDNWNGSILDGLDGGTYMYFAHSYYAKPENPETVLCESEYGSLVFCSGIRQDNIMACQFHPERSGQTGLMVYKNFARLLIENGSK